MNHTLPEDDLDMFTQSITETRHCGHMWTSINLHIHERQCLSLQVIWTNGGNSKLYVLRFVYTPELEVSI